MPLKANPKNVKAKTARCIRPLRARSGAALLRYRSRFPIQGSNGNAPLVFGIPDTPAAFAAQAEPRAVLKSLP